MTKVKHPHSRAERRRLSEKKKARSYTARPTKSTKEGAQDAAKRQQGDYIIEDFRPDDLIPQSLIYAVRDRTYPG